MWILNIMKLEIDVTGQKRSIDIFYKKIGRHQFFLWGHWYPCLRFLVMSALGRSFACVLHHLYAMDSSDSPLLWQLMTSFWPAWQPSHLLSTYLHTHTHTQIVGFEPGNKLTARQSDRCTTKWSTLAQYRSIDLHSYLSLVKISLSSYFTRNWKHVQASVYYIVR